MGLLRRVKRWLFPVYRSPTRYWAQRYAQAPGLVGPGCVTQDERANQEDYALKWERIRSLLPEGNGLTLLDAGCGLGTFTERFLELGYTVSAVDFVEDAVARARERIGDRVIWHVAGLELFDPGQRYDVLACIDVLFHVTDDVLWRWTVRNLTRLSTRWLLIQEHLVPESEVEATWNPRQWHMRCRSLDRYQAELPDWRLVSHDHYALPREGMTKDALLFERRGLTA